MAIIEHQKSKAAPATRELIFKREQRPVSPVEWPKLTSEAAAVSYAVVSSHMQDKSIAYETGIDPATLSKARTGLARLNDDDLNALMDVTGCEAPLYALLLRRGYDPASLRPLETETQRQLRLVTEELQRKEAEHAIAMRAMRELLMQPQPA